jgi:hypothetical protein
MEYVGEPSSKAIIETNRGDILSGFHESARDFCREACLAFTKDGVHLYGRDSAKVVQVQYNLPATTIREDCQGKYSCDSGCIEVGINTKILASCLSSVACGDLVGFSVDMDNEPDRLIIRCQNPNSGKRSCYKVIIPERPYDPVETYISIEGGDYNSELVMNSMLFHDMLRDLTKSDATDVRVCCDGKRLVLFANGRHIKAAFEIRAGDDPSHFRYIPKPSDRWPVCECFSITFLQKVAKAKGVSTDIHIYLQPNFPIAFAYKTPLGLLSFSITPRDDVEWLETPEIRNMPPPSDDINGIIPRQKSNGSKKRQASSSSSSSTQHHQHQQKKITTTTTIDDDDNDDEEEDRLPCLDDDDDDDDDDEIDVHDDDDDDEIAERRQKKPKRNPK